MKKKAWVIAALAFVCAVSCGKNPLYPFKDDPRCDFYGKWVDPGGDYFIVTKDRIERYDNWGTYFDSVICRITSWEPYSDPGNPGYTSGYHLFVTMISTTNPSMDPAGHYCLLIHPDGNSLMIGIFWPPSLLGSHIWYKQ